MQLTKAIQLPDTLSRSEKAAFLEDMIVYLHDQLEETESVPTQRAFGFIGTTGAIAAACSICGLGMVSPIIAIPGAVIIAACSIASGVTLAKDCIESPELIDLQKRLVHVLESKEINQWVKLWEETGTDSFQRRLSYACKGSFTSKGAFRHNSGSNPFDVAALFGGNKTVKPWEKVKSVETELPTIVSLPNTSIGQHTRLNAVDVAVALPTSTSPLLVPNTGWIDDFISQTALVWGNQGSGKSWMVRYIAKLKKDKGYRVVVLDPDSNRAEWEGVESYHDFEEIAEFLNWYVEELKGRYKAFNASSMTEDAWRAKLWADGKAISVVCEEVTTYVDLIEDKELLTQFFRLGLTKSRKQEMPLTFVSHNNTQSALGGVKGLANLIARMLQVELKTKVGSNGQPVSSGKGAIKRDGSTEWVSVTLPKLEHKITNFGELQPTTKQQQVAHQPVELQRPTDTPNKQQLNAAMVAQLKATSHHTLWEFARDELGAENSEEIKAVLEAIAELIFDNDLTSLKDKFRLRSKTDVRYSYAGYSKKVAQTHRQTENICCLCHQNQSQEAHHIEYLGAEDEAGGNMKPVCLDCHKATCHAPENWTQLSTWKSCNTPEFRMRLNLEYQYAISNKE